MPTSFPGGLDTFNNPTSSDNLNTTGVLHHEQHANANDALEAIEAELGVNPSGTYSTVAEALSDLSTQVLLRMTGVATTDTAAIQAAIDGIDAGRPTVIRILCDANQSGLGVINSTINLNKPGVWIEADGVPTSEVGARLRWSGTAGGTMVIVSAPRSGLRRVSLNASSLAATCVAYHGNGERQGYEDISCENFTGSGMIIGNGVANNNGFVGKGSLYLRGLAGSTPLVVNAQATEDIRLETVSITAAVGVTAAMARLVDIQLGHVRFQELILDDDYITGYGMRLNVGSIGIDDLISECAQTLETTFVNRDRGSYILRGDLRSSAPGTGEYAMKLQVSGNDKAPFLLGAVRVNRKAGAANRPDVLIAGATCYDNGLYFTSSDTGVTGVLRVSATGNVARPTTRKLLTNLYYTADGAAGTGVYSDGLLCVHPFEFPHGTIVDRIGINVMTAATATVVRLGIYEAGTDGLPGNLLVDAGTVDASTTGFKELTISQLVGAGRYYFGAVAQGGAPSLRHFSSIVALLGGSTTAIAADPVVGFSRSAVSGALPTPFGAATTYRNLTPRVLIRTGG